MELKFLVLLTSTISTEPEVRWWYSCIVEEVERMGYTTVRYLIQWMSPRAYTLVCTIHVLVSDNVLVLFNCTAVLMSPQGLHVIKVTKVDVVSMQSSILYMCTCTCGPLSSWLPLFGSFFNSLMTNDVFVISVCINDVFYIYESFTKGSNVLAMLFL